MFSDKYVLVLWTHYLTNQYDNHMAAIDQLSTCAALCWNIDFYHVFSPPALIMLSTGYTCPHFAEFLSSWNWHISEEKVSVELNSTRAAAAHPRTSSKGGRGQPASMLSQGFTAALVQRLLGSSWCIDFKHLSEILCIWAGKCTKINHLLLLHRLVFSSIQIYSLNWEETWVCRLNVQMWPCELSIYIRDAYSVNWWSCPSLEGDWLPLHPYSRGSSAVSCHIGMKWLNHHNSQNWLRVFCVCCAENQSTSAAAAGTAEAQAGRGILWATLGVGRKIP